MADSLSHRCRRALVLAVLTLVGAGWFVASPGGQQRTAAGPDGLEASLRGRMEMLASDALGGRRSASRDSHIAATYIASELRSLGVEPLGDDDGYLQRFDVRSSAPQPGGGGRSGAGPGGPPVSDEAMRAGWNVIGRIRGRSRPDEVILLSAHLDHVGIRPGDDPVYNGADDNASGVALVLELATALARGSRPARTIVFAFFDAEELGGRGSAQFLETAPVAFDSIILNLNVEMVGRPDMTLPPGTLWLTGYERSTLGPAFADRGARIVADPRPAERFFERSDNIAFARRGIVAHSLSSFGMHADYHRPSDDLSAIDFEHLADVTRMTLDLVRWLANSSFMPEWREGMRPAPGGERGGAP
jgi:Zn-dependent M28 family amino/carboxypeptidase